MDSGSNCSPTSDLPKWDIQRRSQGAPLLHFLEPKDDRLISCIFLFTPTPFNSFLKTFSSVQAEDNQTIRHPPRRAVERNGLEAHVLLTASSPTPDTRTKLQSAGFENVECIYPGIDLERFSKPKDPEVLEKLNLSPDDFVVSYVGEYARLSATDMIAGYARKTCLIISPAHNASRSDAGGHPPIQRSPHSNSSSHFVLIKQCRSKRKMKLSRNSETPAFSTPSDSVIRFPLCCRALQLPISSPSPSPICNGKFDVPLVILEALPAGNRYSFRSSTIRRFSNPKISATIPVTMAMPSECHRVTPHRL